ncbi:MAG: hypothetical protein BYD32DRAFT_428067, partial [Podila humilis]
MCSRSRRLFSGWLFSPGLAFKCVSLLLHNQLVIMHSVEVIKANTTRNKYIKKGGAQSDSIHNPILTCLPRERIGQHLFPRTLSATQM